MECIQIIVKVKSQDIVNLLKEKGNELDNLISLHGQYATFAGDYYFSWKWLADNLPFMNNWYDADCMEFREDNVTIVAALWQHDGDEALTQWYACNGCSDDLIFDNKYVNQILAEVQSETEITKFDFDRTAWLNARAQKAKPVSNKITVPSREEITRDWLISLTIADWQDLLKQQVVRTKILDEWENPIFKKLQLQYTGLSYEFPRLALQAIEEGKGWVGVEAIKAKPVFKAKPVLNKK
jgi:predicted ATPase